MAQRPWYVREPTAEDVRTHHREVGKIALGVLTLSAVLAVVTLAELIFELWLLWSGVRWIRGEELPSLLGILPPLDQWPVWVIALQMLILLIVGRMTVKTWEKLGPGEFLRWLRTQ